MRSGLLATLPIVSALATLACQSERVLPSAMDGTAVTSGNGGAVGTGGAIGTGSGGSGTGVGGGAGGDSTATFQYNGALSFAPAIVVKPERVEISAPIVPRTSVIYAPFPTSLEGEQQMAHDASLLFDWLLVECAPYYPTITLAPADGSPLSQAQLATNYDQVGRCAYEQFVAKPYWIPRLVDDVDICGTEMGAGWRLITEADLASLTEADFQKVADTWDLHTIGGGGLGFFYSTLAIWVRADDGSIQSGTLAPGFTGSHVIPLPDGVSTSTNHYEGSLGLRCIRRTDLR
ncbi:MAG TPA: hypothetical protein VN903_20430 [Polyangia bacterium]|jgi:hypothetical protein|nr:hypothetical protein [Polyangia bacterium]